MAYNSFKFLFAFLPAALLGYYLLGRLFAPRIALGFVTLASLLFYSWGHWSYGAVLVGSIVANFFFALWIVKRQSRWALALGIIANLGLLGYFKYTGFLLSVLFRLSGRPFSGFDLLLPLGISFFTFQQIAFLIDLSRGQVQLPSFDRFLLFVSFFPHVVAGPIVRGKQTMPQFCAAAVAKWVPRNLSIGLALLTFGLAKKVLIAERCGPWADAVFDFGGHVAMLEAWAGAVAYTMQLYFDFSGYTDIVLGVAMLFNIELPGNFDAPYKARSIVDFWRRWHISLSQWFRDYVFLKLSYTTLRWIKAESVGPMRTETFAYVAVSLVTMTLCGLWHGAGFTFIAWGAYHGALLAASHLARHTRRMPAFVARALTFLSVMMGWVLFRSSGFHRAAMFFGDLFDFSSLRGNQLPRISGGLKELGILAALLLFVNLAPTSKQWLESRELRPIHGVLLACLLGACFFAIRQASSEAAPNPFLYFRF